MKRIAMALLVAASCNAWADEASYKVVDELLSLTPTARSLEGMRREFDTQMQGMISTTSQGKQAEALTCLLYTSPSPRDRTRSRMPSSA